MSNDIKSGIEEMLLADPMYQKAIEEMKAEDGVVQETVDKILRDIMARVDNPDDKFDIIHGFKTLGKCLNYFTQTLCKDAEHFNSEIISAHGIVSDKVMRSLEPAEACPQCGYTTGEQFNPDNFTLRKLMLISGSIIDYVFWRRALGQYDVDIVDTEAAQPMETTQEPVI